MQSQGLLVPLQGLWIIFWAISCEQSYSCWNPSHAENIKYTDTRVVGARWLMMLSLNFLSNSPLEAYSKTDHTQTQWPIATLPLKAFPWKPLRCLGLLSTSCLDSLLSPAIKTSPAFNTTHNQLIDFIAQKWADQNLVWYQYWQLRGCV